MHGRCVTFHGSRCGCRPPLLCWHGTSIQLPVKLSVGTADPARTQHWALLNSHRSACWFCSRKTPNLPKCLRACGWGKRGGIEGEGGGGGLRERYVACNVTNPLLKAIDHCLFCFPSKKRSRYLFTAECLREIPQYELITFGFYHALWQVIFLSAYNCVCLQLIICVNLSRLLLVGFIGYISYFKLGWAQQEYSNR